MTDKELNKKLEAIAQLLAFNKAALISLLEIQKIDIDSDPNFDKNLKEIKSNLWDFWNS